MKQTSPPSLSPQAIFCQTPKILAVVFPSLWTWKSMFSTDLHFRLLKPWVTIVPQSSHHMFHTDWGSLCCHCCCSKILLPSHHLLMLTTLKRLEKPTPKSKHKLSMLFATSPNMKGAEECYCMWKLLRAKKENWNNVIVLTSQLL